MKALFLLVFACLSASWAQPAPPAAPPFPDLPDEAKIAEFDDGSVLTMGEFKKIFQSLPPDSQQGAIRNREAFLHQYGVMRKLTKLAEEQKLDQESPTKEQLAWFRMQILASAKIDQEMMTTVVSPADIPKYYDANKESKYKQVKVKAIYIGFSTAPASHVDSKGKKVLTEDEAKAKAEKLVAGLRGGADFVKLVKENSDDQPSRDKDGDMPVMTPADTIPDAIRSVVFALKQGQVSDPVRQASGFYIFRVEEAGFKPLSQVRDEIFTEIKQRQFSEWMKNLDATTKVQVTNPAFLGGGQPAAARP
jgi:parvulin-like peptidyl-prolyl isomerase